MEECTGYRLNMAAASFGECKCGRPKNHPVHDQAAAPQPVAKLNPAAAAKVAAALPTSASTQKAAAAPPELLPKAPPKPPKEPAPTPKEEMQLPAQESPASPLSEDGVEEEMSAPVPGRKTICDYNEAALARARSFGDASVIAPSSTSSDAADQAQHVPTHGGAPNAACSLHCCLSLPRMQRGPMPTISSLLSLQVATRRQPRS